MEYDFKWGQKESIMHAGFQTNNLGREKYDKKTFSVFMFLEKGVLNVYFPRKGTPALLETGKEFLDTRKGYEKLEWSRSRREKFWELMSFVAKVRQNFGLGEGKAFCVWRKTNPESNNAKQANQNTLATKPNSCEG